MHSNNGGAVNIQIIQVTHDVKVVIGDVQRRPKYAGVTIKLKLRRCDNQAEVEAPENVRVD